MRSGPAAFPQAPPLRLTFSKSSLSNHYRTVCIPPIQPIHTGSMRHLFHVQTARRGTDPKPVDTMQQGVGPNPLATDPRSPFQISRKEYVCVLDLLPYPPTRNAPHAGRPANPTTRSVPTAEPSFPQAPCPSRISALPALPEFPVLLPPQEHPRLPAPPPHQVLPRLPKRRKTAKRRSADRGTSKGMARERGFLRYRYTSSNGRK